MPLVHSCLLPATLTLTSALVLALPVYAQATIQPDSLRVTILQLNDVYQTTPTDGGKSGGLARVATLREKIVAESPNTLFLLAGDTLSPSVASTVFKGEQRISGWTALGLHYALPGNHEFDFGPDTLLARMKESKFVWLGSNVIDRRTNKPFGGTPPYVIRNFDGVKIGLFGLLTPDTATTSKPGDNVRFVNPVLAARNIVRRLRQEGAQVIIAITHLAMSEDKELARRVPQIDVIVGGHEHELLQSHAGRAPIFKWGSDARTLGRIDLNISTATRKVESIFGNLIVKIEVKGATLRAALENGVSRIVEEEESGRFPQVSGLSFTFDGRKPAGSRVVEVRINGQPLDEKKNYSLALAAYLVNGGDGYSMFAGARLLVDAESAQIDSAILANAITSAGTVSPQIERRSKRLDVSVVEK